MRFHTARLRGFLVPFLRRIGAQQAKWKGGTLVPLSTYQPFESSVTLELITLQQQLYHLTVQNPHLYRDRVWVLNCPIHQKMREGSSQCPRVITFRATYQSSDGSLISQSTSSQQHTPYQAKSPSQRWFQRLIHEASLISAQQWISESISTIQASIIPIQEHRFLYSPATPIQVQFQSSDGSLISQSIPLNQHIPFQAQSPSKRGFQSLIHLASLISVQRWISASIATVNKVRSSSAKTSQAKYHSSEVSLITHQSLSFQQQNPFQAKRPSKIEYQSSFQAATLISEQKLIFKYMRSDRAGYPQSVSFLLQQNFISNKPYPPPKCDVSQGLSDAASHPPGAQLRRQHV